MDTLEAIVINGPNEVGLSTGSDRLSDAAQRLYGKGAIKDVLHAIPFGSACSPRVRRLVHTCAMLLHTATFSCLRDSTCVLDGAAPAQADAEKPEPRTESDASSAILMLFSTKINWWQTNHHTGTSSTTLTGFALKASRAIGLDNLSPADISAIWMAVHWFDTKIVLAHLGVTGLPREIIRGLPVPSAELVMRLNSNPAGTALWSDVCVVMRNVRSTVYAAYVPTVCWLEYESIRRSMEVVAKSAARFHMGSMHLTGKPRLQMNPVSEALAGAVKSCMSVLMDGASICKSMALRQCQEDAELTALLTGMRRALSRAAGEAVSTANEMTLFKSCGLPNAEQMNLVIAQEFDQVDSQ